MHHAWLCMHLSQLWLLEGAWLVDYAGQKLGWVRVYTYLCETARRHNYNNVDKCDRQEYRHKGAETKEAGLTWAGET